MSSPEINPDKNQSKSFEKIGTIRSLAYRTAMSLLRVGPESKNYPKVCGLIDGAIFGHTIWHPVMGDDRMYLDKTTMEGVGFVSFDANRPQVFPEAFENGDLRIIKKGRLASFLLDEVMANQPDERTPNDLLDIRDLKHIAKFEKPTVDELIDAGMVSMVTNAEAYSTLGLYDEFGKELKSRSIAEDKVFQVTPKGNTLIWITQDGGDKTPEHSESAAPAFGWLPGVLQPNPSLA